MFFDITREKIQNSPCKYKLLLDTSAYVSFETICIETGVFIPEVLANSNDFDYFITGDVFKELLSGPRNMKFAEYFKDKLINGAGGFDPNSKHSLNIIKKNDNLFSINLYKISATDQNLISTCFSYPELILVANDEKLIKNATVVLDGNKRVKGVASLVDLIVQTEPSSDKISLLRNFIQLNRKSIKDFDLKNIKQYGHKN